MSRTRKLALVTGVMYLVTFVTSIPAAFLKEPVTDDPAYVTGSGADGMVVAGGILELILAIACVGTAVAIYPVIRRQSETSALGFVAARVIEAAVILVGVFTVLAVVTLRQGYAAAPDAGAADSLLVTGRALVAVHDWAFLIGLGLIPALNALFLGSALLRSGLVPRAIPLVGLIGAPLLVASALATMVGLHDQVSATAALAALPIAGWEFSIGVWLVAKGFRPDAVARLGLAGTSRVAGSPAAPVPA